MWGERVVYLKKYPPAIVARASVRTVFMSTSVIKSVQRVKLIQRERGNVERASDQ